MTWFLESPWPSVLLGACLEIALAIALVHTGRAAIAIAMGCVLVFVSGLVVLERVVVTETEEVEDALDHVARAVTNNDVAEVLASISPGCPRRGEAESAMRQFTVRSVRIGGDLEIRFNRLTIPPSAVAYFTCTIDGRDNRGTVPYEHLIRKFKVTLHREGNHWLIADYADSDFRERRER